MNTKLRYLWDASETTFEANIVNVQENDGITTIFLDETIFHAQGGGQPTDKGIIKGVNGSMQVEMVKVLEDGRVTHQGEVQGLFNLNEKVTCTLDTAWRTQMTQLHSAGHILRFAMLDLGLDWKPTRGFHFPVGTYIESEPESLEEVTEETIRAIENAANEHVRKNYKTIIEWEGDKRIVHFGPHKMACGGTHIAQGSDIQKITITKIKKKSGRVRFSYTVT